MKNRGHTEKTSHGPEDRAPYCVNVTEKQQMKTYILFFI